MARVVKQKPRQCVAAISVSGLRVLRALYHRPDALRAHNHVHFAATIHHQHPLKIGAEGPPSGAQGEAPIVSENRHLTAFLALSHFQDPFYDNTRSSACPLE
jgi:hypothetical protein